MMNFNIFSNMFILFYIVILESLCSLSISAEQGLNESNITTLHLTESSISDAIGNISRVPDESMKSKVRKRPGVPPIPDPVIISDSQSVNDPANINCVNLRLKNSTVSPRKGACNPPPVNDLSKLNSSFTNEDKSEFSGSNHSVINSEVVSKDNRTDAFQSQNGSNSTLQSQNDSNSTLQSQNDSNSTLHSQNGSNSNVESAKELNLHSEDKETFSIITTTVPPSAAAIIPKTFNSTINSTNITSSNILENNLDPNTLLTTIDNEVHNVTMSSKKPFTTSALDDNGKKSNTWAVIGAILFVLILCAFVGYIAYKRLYAYWDRRHYSRMDFLIDGLYEM